MDPLKIKATGDADLKALCPFVQDALVSVDSIHFDPDTHFFMMGLNRVKVENKLEAATQDRPERIHTCLYLKNAEATTFEGVSLTDKGMALNLLTIEYKAPLVRFIFSNNVDIKVQVKDLSLYLHDLGEAWPAKAWPTHEGV